jgi:peptide chain release factor
MSWLLITAGRGPGECQIAVRGVAAAFADEAHAAGVEAELLETEEAPHGLMSALFSVRGAGAVSFARSWQGSVRWTCSSPLRKGWGRKNWFVGVSVLEPPPPAATLRESDLRFEAYRASGPGGQHVNKTNSAVRVTHLPTGLVATAQEERSQYRNKVLALARLTAAIAARGKRAEAASERDRWSRHDQLERGNEVRAYEGDRFRRLR